MTDKVQKIREKVEMVINRRLNLLNGDYFDLNEEVYGFTNEIVDIIDSLQEEPVSKNFEEALAQEWKGYNDRGAATVDALEDNTQELAFAKGFYHGWHYRKEEPVSDDLEKAATNYATHLDKNWSTVKDGYIAENEKEAFKAGAEWQKQQMMKDAVDGVVHHYGDDEIAAIHYNDPKGVPMSYFVSSKGLNAGDNVKLITVKED